jgi:putative transposase
VEATRANETWAMDVVHDQLVTGRKLQVPTIVDTWSRFAPAVDPKFGCKGEDAASTLDRVCGEVGDPGQSRFRIRVPGP